MREWTDIVAAFNTLCEQGKACALATVVRVEGSAYRRPGARMLVAEDGRTWGGVSGGCLERDVADRARGVIAAGKPFVHRYDTSDEELIQRGVTTGCGGTIDVLIQPLSHDSPGVIPELAALLGLGGKPNNVSILTIAHATGRWASTAGLSHNFGTDCHLIPDDLVAAVVAESDSSRTHCCTVAGDGSEASVLVEHLSPPQRLVIVGGGPDAVPVAIIAKTLGWRVAVVAARPALAIEMRFAHVDERYVTGPEAPLSGVPITAECAVVVMTHNLARDASVLAAITARPRYLGLLGPRHRTERAIAALPSGHPGRSLHSPVGLDIGSESPEEIALSIIAEVQACVRAADARPLHARRAPDAIAPDIAWQA
ncbi:MAG: Xanthine and dehydrogenase maturation factor, XdhC/CoxF family [Phycisphaerales bacterium]|nr:Xanthine and dehydrogenase maturation factor, XdhC/CoxF family [Phycisphaerales bacterium]